MVTRFEKFKASFWCLFKTFIPLKMFQTFRRAKRPFYKHAWITNLSNFDKKKKISRNDHRSFNIISKKYSSKNISRSEKFASSSRVTSIVPSHTCPANWTTLVSPRETKNSLESKNSWTKRSKQFRSHEKESHPPQAKISSFLLTRSNLRFRSIFSSFFFFFRRFHAAVAFHSDDRSTFRAFPRDTASCSNCQRLWKRAWSTREEGEGQYSSRFFDDDVSLSPLLVELLEWGCSKRK